MHDGKINFQNIAGILTIILIISGATILWGISKEETTLKRDGEVLATHKWHVESERSFINKNSWYRKNVMCPRIIAEGGHETATRCYYAPNTYEQLSRSLINTDLLSDEPRGLVIRYTPQYAYGTRGSYAGILQETWLFIDTLKEEEFPKKYEAYWMARDTRNYKLVWRVWNLKDQPLPDGEYTYCNYEAKNVKINLGPACAQLDRAIVEGNKIWFYFKSKRGDQHLQPNIVDPVTDGYTIEDNGVVFDDSNAYFKTTPHTLSKSGIVYQDLKSKVFSGDIDFAIGVDSDNATLKWFEINRPVYNPINDTYDDNWVRYNNPLIVNYNYDGKNKWYVAKNINISAGVTYQARFYLKVNGVGKYDVAFKPSFETLTQAITNNHLYFSDPWYNDTTMVNNNCTNNEWIALDNGSSTARPDKNGSLRLPFYVETSLVEFFRFENGTGGELCNFSAQNNGAVFQPIGKIGGAYDYTPNDYMNLSDQFGIFDGVSNDFTVVVWFESDSTTAAQTPITFEDEYTVRLGYGFIDDTLRAIVKPGGSTKVLSTTDLTGTTYTMAALTYSTISGFILYANGDSKDTEPTVGAMGTTANEGSNIGKLDTTGRYFNGEIDEISIYKKNLSIAEILALYNLGAGRVYDNTTDAYFYSIINDTGSDINWVVPTINCTENGFACSIRISTDNRTTFTNWLTESNNSENISVTTGQYLSFDVNLSGNATHGATLDNFGMVSGFEPGAPENTTPSVTLNSPANNSQQLLTSVTFNYTVIDNDGDSMTVELIIDGELNITNSSVSNNTDVINTVSGFSLGDHNWSVNVSDGTNVNNSETRFFTILFGMSTNVTLILQHNGTNYSGDIDVETDTEWTAIATVDPDNQTVCISADHPSIGINASCDTGTTQFNFTVISGINTFNDSTTKKNMTFSGSENQSVTLKSISNNSEMDSVKINVFGYVSGSDYVKDFELDFNNDSTDVQAFRGELKGSKIVTSEFYDGTTTWLGGYVGSGVKTAGITLPKDFDVTNASMDLIGSQKRIFDNITETLITDENGYFYRPYAPKCVHDEGTEYLYCFAGECSVDNVAICPGRYNSTVRITIGASFGAAVSKTMVPYQAGFGACAVSTGGTYAYIFGGYDETTYVDTSYRYNYGSDSWTSRTAVPEVKAFHQCVYHPEDGLVYLFGGYTTGSTWDITGYAYNVSENTWSAALADMPDGVEQGWLENYNSTHLISFGGTRRGGVSGGRTYLYDIAGDSWTTLDSIPDFLYANGGANIDGEIYSYGGVENPAGTVKKVYRYNESADNWDLMTTALTYNLHFEYCNEVETHTVCHGSGGFGVGSVNRQLFHLPREVSIQIDDASTSAYQGTTELTSTTTNTGDFAATINQALSSCDADITGLCNLTVYVGNVGSGDITIDNLEINTTPGAIDLGTANITCAISTCNPLIRAESEEAGILEIRTLNITYEGTGNFTWNASTRGDTEYLPNSTADVWTIYYSKFSRVLPYTWTETLFLVPSSYNISNVSFFGQTDTIPEANLTSQAQDKTFNLSIRLNETIDSCLELKTSLNNSILFASVINTTWQYFNQITTGASQAYWFWGSLDECNASVNRYLKPGLQWEACCETCTGCP